MDIPFKDFVIEKIKETDKGIVSFFVREMGNVRNDFAERALRRKLSGENIGELCMLQTGPGTGSVFPYLCPNGEALHGAENTEITDDPAGFSAEPCVKGTVAGAGVCLVECCYVFIQYALRFLIAVFLPLALQPLVIAAAGKAKNLTQPYNSKAFA